MEEKENKEIKGEKQEELKGERGVEAVKEEKQVKEVREANEDKDVKRETENREAKEVKKKRVTTRRPVPFLGMFAILGPIIGAFIGYLGTIQAVNIPIHTTQTAAAQTTLAPMKIADQGYLEIEQIPQHVFVFAGNNNPDGGYGTFDLIYQEGAHPVYQMTYSLPTGKYGYAGLVFQFPDGYDLSDYQEIKFSLHFQQPGDQIELYIRDIAGHNNTVQVGGNGQSELELGSAFSNFPDINFKAVKEIGWIASTTYAQGDHQLQVKDVYLVK
jgi:hypothetical protein